MLVLFVVKNNLYSINLIKNKKGAFFDRFINWALSIGRLVVVLTEIIALGTFLYRFSLDRNLIDLHDKIKQQQAIVKYLKPNEDKFRNLQARLILVAKFTDNSVSMVKTFDEFISFAPNDLLFKSLSITESDIKIDATVRSVSSLSRFIRSIKTHPKAQWVSLDRIENKTSSSTVAFVLTVGTKKRIQNIQINKFQP